MATKTKVGRKSKGAGVAEAASAPVAVSGVGKVADGRSTAASRARRGLVSPVEAHRAAVEAGMDARLDESRVLPPGGLSGDGLVATPLVDHTGREHRGSPPAGRMHHGFPVPDDWPVVGASVDVKGAAGDWAKSGIVGAANTDDDGYVTYEVRAEGGKRLGTYQIGSLRPHQALIDGEPINNGAMMAAIAMEAASRGKQAVFAVGSGGIDVSGDAAGRVGVVEENAWARVEVTGLVSSDADDVGQAPAFRDGQRVIVTWQGGEYPGLVNAVDVLDVIAEVVTGEPVVFEPGDVGELRQLMVVQVHPSTFNPRRRFDEGELAELAASIAQHGLIEPILVREDEGGYEIVAGERRWRAHKLAGLDTISAIVRPVEDLAARIHALTENLVRADLNPVEEAGGYRELRKLGMSVEAIADAVHRSRPVVSNAMRLLDLPEGVLAMVEDGRLSTSHGLALVRFAAFPETCEMMAALAVEVVPPITSKALSEAGLPFENQLRDRRLTIMLGSPPFSECTSCPFGANFAASWNRNYCLRPDHLRELEAVRKAQTEERMAAQLENQREFKQKQLEEAAAALDAATSEKERGRAKQVIASAEGALKAGIQDLGKLNWTQYQVIGDYPPSECNGGCPCRVIATQNGRTVEACLNKGRYQQLQTRDTKARNVTVREALRQTSDELDAAFGSYSLGASAVSMLLFQAWEKMQSHGSVVSGVLATGRYNELKALKDSNELNYKKRIQKVKDTIAAADPYKVASFLAECQVRHQIATKMKEPACDAPAVDWLVSRMASSVVDAEPSAEVSRQTLTERRYDLGDTVMVALVEGEGYRDGSVVGWHHDPVTGTTYEVQLDDGTEVRLPASKLLPRSTEAMANL